jgi:hypothetical protein
MENISSPIIDDAIFSTTDRFEKKVRRLKKAYCQAGLDELKKAIQSIESFCRGVKKMQSFENCGLEVERNCLFKYGKENIDLHLIKALTALKALHFVTDELKRKKKEK